MKDFTTNDGAGVLSHEAELALNARILRTMELAVAVAAVASLIFAQWRVATGILLGGTLSVLSYHWMRNSIAAAFRMVQPGAKPEINVVQYVLRYLIIGVAVYSAYLLNIVSLPATIIGLCSFVVALFAEAIREFYFTIVHREEA